MFDLKTGDMKFLIVRLSSLGDIVHTLPIVWKLRKSFPSSQIDWLVGKSGYELLSSISEINNVLLPSFKNISFIQNNSYDYVIDVQGLFKSAFLSKLAKGKKIVGFRNAREFSYLFYDEKINVGNLFVTSKHIVDLNLELVANITEKSNEKIKFLVPRIKEPSNKTICSVNKESIIVFPLTTWESKQWPLDYWFHFISRISNNFSVYLCASNSDLTFLNILLSKLDEFQIPYINLIGKTNIVDLIYLIQNVRLVIGLDSFGLHLSSAIRNDYGNPEVVGIYGPTSPNRNGPYGQIENCFYLSHLDCISCRKKKCPLGHHKCMSDILPSMLIDKVYSTLTAESKVGFSSH